MKIQTVSAHFGSAEPGDIRLGSPVECGGNTLARSLYIGDSIAITLSAGGWYRADTVKAQIAALTALADAATEAAHWLEDMAQDQLVAS